MCHIAWVPVCGFWPSSICSSSDFGSGTNIPDQSRNEAIIGYHTSTSFSSNVYSSIVWYEEASLISVFLLYLMDSNFSEVNCLLFAFSQSLMELRSDWCLLTSVSESTDFPIFLNSRRTTKSCFCQYFLFGWEIKAVRLPNPLAPTIPCYMGWMMHRFRWRTNSTQKCFNILYYFPFCTEGFYLVCGYSVVYLSECFCSLYIRCRRHFRFPWLI